MRPDPKNPRKIAKIIDHVGNRKRHGAIDEERQWYLAAKPEREGEAIYKVCPDSISYRTIEKFYTIKY